MSKRRHILLVTGKLAEPALRRVMEACAATLDLDYTIAVLPITVAALMTPAWIARRLDIPHAATEVLLPGYCQGDLQPLQERVTIPIACGPKDLHRLPEYLDPRRASASAAAYEQSQATPTIEILAEINHAPRLSLPEIRAQADQLADDGADWIDLGCEPGQRWFQVAETVRMLRERNLRVSIDSFDPHEVADAVRAGAELVLSVNSSNRQAAADWGCEVVAIPDTPEQLATLDETVEFLDQHRVPCCLDPILSPIGYGFAASLIRYAECRRRYPEHAMLMGIGNVSELTDVDSAGINLLLLACCAEWKIQRILTTQVINWARSSVRECVVARQLVAFAVQQQVLPKHLDKRLIQLRDEQVVEPPEEELSALAAQLRDHNYRIFAARGAVHAVTAGRHLQGADPFVLFAELLRTESRELEPSHAFYLGYEFAKAKIALILSKQYRQDEALDWGLLTEEEPHHGRSGP